MILANFSWLERDPEAKSKDRERSRDGRDDHARVDWNPHWIERGRRRRIHKSLHTTPMSQVPQTMRVASCLNQSSPDKVAQKTKAPVATKDLHRPDASPLGVSAPELWVVRNEA
jgi:hypothetical protein